MKINLENYETILVDYIDGRLSPQDEAELMTFLLLNPKIAEELEGLQQTTLNPSPIAFPSKSNLKKQVVQPFGINNEVDYLCIANLEGDISSADSKRLDELIKNDENIRHYQTVFSSTKLNVPHEIVFPHKLSLKRLTVIPIRQSTFRIAMGVAATVAIMLAVYTTINFNYSPQLVTNNSIVSTQNTTNNQAKEVPLVHNNAPLKESSIEKRIVKKNKPESTVEMQGNKTVDAENENIPIESIQALPARLNQIAQVNQSKLNLPSQIQTSKTITNEANQQNSNYDGSSREYSLASLAMQGLKKAANTLGVEYNIKKSNTGKVEKLTIESKLLAFSTTRSKKDE